MAAFAITNFGGMVPRLENQVLPANMAAAAVDCDLRPNAIDGLPQRVFQIRLPGAKKAYHFRNRDQTQTTWLSLPSLYSSVCRNPVPNDIYRRVYWTNPADLNGPWFSTWDRINAGAPPYQLGMVYPPSDPSGKLTVTATGGTTDGSIPFDERVYVYTFVNEFNEESAPNAPSDLVAGPPDATWTVSGLPNAAANPPSKPYYPAVNRVRLYRTVTGASGSVDYYLVGEWAFPNVPNPYVDPLNDFAAAGNGTLPSTTWSNPPVALDGLVALPGGMLIGFVGNTIHFCEPYNPHAWPTVYDQSVLYDITALTVWQGSLVIMTQGFPSTGTGKSPANFLIEQTQVSEPMVSRGSVVTTQQGVFYASQNGLVLMTYAGLVNATYQTMTKNVWLNDYHARTLMACRHRSQYMAVALAIAGNDQAIPLDEYDSGFIVDVQESNLGFVRLSDQTKDIINVWTDEEDGNTYMISADGSVYMWDNELRPLRPFRWRSKHYLAPAGISLGAAHIQLDPSVADELPPLDPAVQDPSLVLPDGVNAVFRLYVGPTLNLAMTRQLSKADDIFRCISGFRAYDWQCEVVSRVRIKSIELASTFKELKGV